METTSRSSSMLHQLTIVLLISLLSLSLNGYAQTALPDYIISQADVTPTTAISGVTQIYTYSKVKNDGEGYAGTTVLRIYINQDTTSTAGTAFGMMYFNETLMPGYSTDERSINNTVTLPAGNYYMNFKVAVQDDEEESDLTNNFRYVALSILASITVETDENGTVSGLDTTGYAGDEAVSLQAVPNEGCDFVSWTEGDVVISTSSTLEFAAQENRVIKANFKKREFTVCVTSNPVAGGQNDTCMTVTYGTRLELDAVSNTGYSFVSWTKDDVVVADHSSYSFLVYDSVDLVANFGKSYYISAGVYDNTGGSTTGSGTYFENDTVTIAATPAEGYIFICWVNSSDLSTYSTEGEITFVATENVSLRAYFRNTFHISVSPEDATMGEAEGSLGMEADYHYDSTCTLTATPYDGYSFVSWIEDDTVASTENPHSFMVDDDRVFLAKFSRISYLVTLEKTTGGTVSGQGFCYYGTSKTIKATPSTGYNFVNWTEDGTIVSTSTSYDITVYANRTFKANFVPKTYTINLEWTTGGGVSGQGTYDYGTSQTVTATAGTNYDFVSWTEDGVVVSTSASYTFTISADRTLKATFALKTYTITLGATTGGTVSGQGTYSSGTSKTVTATPATGYDFVSWTEDGIVVSTSASYTFTVSADQALTANFALETYTVTLEVTTGGSVSGQGTYDYGTSQTVVATPMADYSFVSWMEDGVVVSTSASYTFTVSADRALMANFTMETYTITLETTTGGSVSGQGTYGYGSSQTVVATPGDNYKFVSWTEDGTIVSASASYTFTVSADRALTANFALEAYTVTLETTTGGSVSGQGTYDYGTSRTVVATPGDNYQFTSWTENGTIVSTDQSYTFTMSADRVLTANFALETYTITLETTTGGSVSGQGTYDYGTSRTVVATPGDNCQFTNWTENGTIVSTDQSYTFTVSVDRTLTANFVANTYLVTLEATDGGSVSGQGTYGYGTSHTITATPGDNFTFVSWTENDEVVSTDSAYTFTVSADRTLKANFALKTFSITLETTTGGSVSGQGTYAYATTQTVTATPDAAYTFVSWTEDGSVIATEMSYTFMVSENRTLKANFAPRTCTITLSSLIGGTVSGQGTFTYGDSHTITANPYTGYDFIGWIEDGTVVSTDQSYTFTVEGDRTLDATFSVQSFAVSLDATEGGTAAGEGTYIWGTYLAVTAIPDAGYYFINWTEDGVEVSGNEVYSFEVSWSRTITANFGTVTGSTILTGNMDCDVYPNPASDHVRVECSQVDVTTQGTHAILYDKLGNAYLLDQVGTSGNSTTYRLPAVADGIYYMSVSTSDNKNLARKTVVICR